MFNPASFDPASWDWYVYFIIVLAIQGLRIAGRTVILRRPPLAILEIFEKRNPFALQNRQFRASLARLTVARLVFLLALAAFYYGFFVSPNPVGPAYFHKVFLRYENIFWSAAAIALMFYLADIFYSWAQHPVYEVEPAGILIRRDQTLPSDALGDQLAFLLRGQYGKTPENQTLDWEKILKARQWFGGTLNLTVDTGKRRQVISIPSAVAGNRKFRKLVLEHAPVGHPLRDIFPKHRS